jgi:flavodoxin
MEALIVYYSKTGVTKKFAEAIAYQLKKRVDVKIKSIEEVTSQDILDCKMLYLGCGTEGMYIFGQKPEKPWADFVSNLPKVEGKRTVLFTTYKISTGEVFHKMKALIEPKGYRVIGSMKTSNGKFDYFSNGVLRYSLYQLLESHVSEQKEYAEAEVMEMA